MKEKKFTLVELVLVLIFVGVIIGVAIKAMALVDQSEAKKMTTNLQKLSSAFYIYHSKFQKYPGGDESFPDYQGTAGSTEMLVKNDLIYNGIASPKDFTMGLGVDQIRFVTMDDAEIEVDNGEKALGFDWGNNTDGDKQYIGVKFERIDPAKSVGFIEGSSDKLICYIETILDGSNIASGTGRVAFDSSKEIDNKLSTVYDDYNPISQFKDCSQQSLNKHRSVDGYAFQIFPSKQ